MMKNYVIKAALILVCTVLSSESLGKNGSRTLDDKILNQFVPESVKTDPETRAAQTLKNGIRVSTLNTSFNERKNSSYVVVEYRTNSNCEIRVLKREHSNYKLMDATRIKFPDELDGCLNMSLKDLDGDGRQELIVQTLNGKEFGSPVIFKWDGQRLLDISPVKQVGSNLTRDFRHVEISDKPIQKNWSYLILIKPMQLPTAEFFKWSTEKLN